MEKLNGKILAGKVLVGDIVKEKKYNSGITISTQGSKQEEGVVYLVGSPIEDQETIVSPGDRIIFAKGLGVSVNIDGDKYILIFHRDILFVKNKTGC